MGGSALRGPVTDQKPTPAESREKNGGVDAGVAEGALLGNWAPFRVRIGSQVKEDA